MKDATLLHGDCLEVLDKIPDGSVDVVLTDPPYSSGGLYLADRKRPTREKYTDTDFSGAARFPDFGGDNMDQRSFTAFMRAVLLKCRNKTVEGGDLRGVHRLAQPSRHDGRAADGGVALQRDSRVGQGEFAGNAMEIP